MELTQVFKYSLCGQNPMNSGIDYSNNTQSLTYSSFSGKGTYTGSSSYDCYGPHYAFITAQGVDSTRHLPNKPGFFFLKDHINSSTLAVDSSMINFYICYLSSNTNTINFNNPYIERSITFKNSSNELNQEVKGFALLANSTSVMYAYKPDGSTTNNQSVYPVYLYENFDTPLVFEPGETKTFNIRFGLSSQS